MKVCVINSLYEPYGRGGAETVVQNTVDGLADAGYEVVVITLGRRREIVRKGSIAIYRIIPFNLFSFLDLPTRPFWLRIPWHFLDLFNFSSYRAVKKILLEEKPVVIMTHNLKGIGYLIPHLLRRLGIRHMHVVHDVQLSRPSGIILFGQEKPFLILDKIYERLCRYLFGSPAAVISPSRWLMEYYGVRGFFYHSPKIILPNPIRKVREQRAAKISSEKMVFTFVGQIEESKGIIFLVETLKLLPEKNWLLKIAGSGRIAGDIQKLISGDERFQFYGYVKPSQLSQLYAQSDATILPSLCYENSPTVISESFSAGVPVIASDIGGVGELIKDQVNGYLFEPGNAKNLTELIRFALHHPDELKKLRLTALASAQSYTLDKYIATLISLFA